MKNLRCLLLCGLLLGCEYDDRYLYVHSYRVSNQLEQSVSGYFLPDPVYYRDSIFFQVATNEIDELLARDGGNGPKIKPIRRDIIPLKELQLILNDTILTVNIESNDLWLYRTEESTAIYTFSITKDLF